MKTILQTIAVAFSMFSALPMPQFAWNERNMRYAMCAFPLVGAVVGAACWLWGVVCQWLSLPTVLMAAGLTMIPIFVTGGIHLDGYADTWDARASHAGPEKRQEIMKDPRMGAFAGIHLCGYYLVTFALWSSLRTFPALPVGLGFCLSRTLSGLAIARFPMAKNTGLAHTFAAAADRVMAGRVLLVLAVVLAAGMCWTGAAGAVMSLAAVVAFAYYRKMSQKEFGGISGDLAGWFLQTAELWMLAVLVLVQYLEVIL